MPDVAGIDRFNYNSHTNHSKAAPKAAEARKASTEDAEVIPAVQDPTVDPLGGK